MLGEVVSAVEGGGMEVFVDGGVRQGTDVLKALALGARAVFIGRPVLWGLAYGGEGGVERVLEILRDEFRLAMMLSGILSSISGFSLFSHTQVVKECQISREVSLCTNQAFFVPNFRL